MADAEMGSGSDAGSGADSVSLRPLPSSAGLGVDTKILPPVEVLFSVPKKVFKRAWKRNLLKRRMRESYRLRKQVLAEAVGAAETAGTEAAVGAVGVAGRHIEIAFICAPSAPDAGKAAANAKMAAGGEMKGTACGKGVVNAAKGVKEVAANVAKGMTAKKAKAAAVQVEIPDFKTIDNAIAKILEQVERQLRK